MQKFFDTLKNATVLLVALLAACVLNLVSWIGGIVDGGFSFAAFLTFLFSVAVYALVVWFTIKNDAFRCGFCLAVFLGTMIGNVWNSFSLLETVAGAGGTLPGVAIAFSVFCFLAYLFLFLSVLALFFTLLAPVKLPVLPFAVRAGICVAAPLLLITGILGFCINAGWYYGFPFLAECAFCVVLIPAIGTLLSGSAKTDRAASDVSGTASSAE